MSVIFHKKIVPEKEILGTKYDYSDSNSRMAQYAFIAPTPGDVVANDGTKIRLPDQCTEKNFREYRECGFDVLLLLGNDKYAGEPFGTSRLKRNLDLSEKVGLGTIVFDERLHDLSKSDHSLVGNEFSSFDALVARVRECLAPYASHPAFYGVTLFDEPRFEQLPAVGEITRAVKAVDPRYFVHTCLLPYFASVDYGLLDFRTATNGGTDEETEEAYRRYLSSHLEHSLADYLAYDNYPIFYSRGDTCVCYTYFHNLQMATKIVNGHGAKLDLTIQTYSDLRTELRESDEDDVRFQALAALAFGARNVSYFTYYLFPTRANTGISQGILDDEGNKMLYYEVRRVNETAQKFYRATAHFLYAGTNLYSAGEEPQLFEKVERTEFPNLSVRVTEPTLVNRLTDAERGTEGYFVLNSSDPAKKKNDRVTLRFGGAKKAVVYVAGDPHFVSLGDEGELVLDLSAGDGAFVLPVTEA